MSNQTIKNYFPIPRIIVISMWVIYLLLVWLFTGYINAVIDNNNNLYGRLPSFDELRKPHFLSGIRNFLCWWSINGQIF